MSDIDNITTSGEMPDTGSTPETTKDPPAPVQTPAEDPDPAAGEKEKREESGVSGISLAMSLCDAVLHAVGPDRFHGGVRPDNISVRDEKLYLGGTLKHTVGEFTPQELEYMAPELFWDGISTPASDVYSIGLVLYSFYNYGRLPFWPTGGAITPNARASALQKRMSDEAIIPPAKADAELAAVILRALAFRTEERWHDVSELRDALGSCDASNSPIDISLAMSGITNRNTDKAGESAAFSGYGRSAGDDGDGPGRRPVRRKKSLSWLWILLALIFVAGAAVLLFSDQFKINGGPAATPEPTAAVTPEPTPSPTEVPTPEATATPEPTKRPSGPKYVVYREDVSWTEAVARCEAKGGWLAMPRSEEELTNIARLCNNEDLTYAWLGASRQTDGSWKTPGGEVLTYFSWSEGEPSMFDAGDGAAENYLLLWKEDEDQWHFNDSREDPLKDYAWAYQGHIGYVCQMWDDQ